jgi:glycosyltransferase involved in cell wall biosynthesis
MNPLALHRGRPLRVLHGTYEIAGQGMMLAKALSEQGCEAHSLAYRVDWDGRVPDLVVDLDRRGGELGRGAAMLSSFAAYAHYYDVFHFHFGTSFLPRQWDLPLLKAMGKRIVFHFHGCEIRNRAHMRASHRLSTCAECDPPFCRPGNLPKQQGWLRARAAKYADLTFFSTLDLAESVPGGEHLPLAIESARWERAGLDRPLPDFARRDGVNGPVVVAHAPTDKFEDHGVVRFRGIKGTRHVIAALEELKHEFPKLELRMIERRPWATMPEFLSECDILVDQLMMGWYGLLAMEGMSERRAVVAYLRDDFRPLLGGCPVQSAESETLVRVLRELIRDPARRAALGEQGAAYVRAHHDTSVVGERLLRRYRTVVDRESAEAPASA